MTNTELDIIEEAERMGFYPRAEQVESIKRLNERMFDDDWGNAFYLGKGKAGRAARREAQSHARDYLAKAIRAVMLSPVRVHLNVPPPDASTGG